MARSSFRDYDEIIVIVGEEEVKNEEKTSKKEFVVPVKSMDHSFHIFMNNQERICCQMMAMMTIINP